MMKVSCLGPEGSYSELAARQLCPDYDVLLCKDFYDVVDCLVAGRSDYAVLPIQNSIQGGVSINLELLSEYDVLAIQSLFLKIDHRLATLQGVALSDIKKVYSHEQAIGQCSKYLAEKLPSAKCLFASSTAESLSKLDHETAGIVGAHIKKEGVVLSGENIANEKNNRTQFVLMERKTGLPQKSSALFFVAVTEHVPGALLSLLQVFSAHRVNLTRIESRPVADMSGCCSFFIEISGDIADANISSAIADAKKLCKKFKLLGAYL